MDQQATTHTQQQFEYFRTKPDGDIDPAGEAGWYLQRERERHMISLEAAGEACGIHPHHLEGIELGDLTRLPPRTEALRMIGTYAQFLKFDPQPLVLHYAQFLPQPLPISKRAKPRRPRPLSSAKIIQFASFDKLKSIGAGAGGVVASVLAAVIAFQGLSYLLSSPDNSARYDAKIVAETPADELPAAKPTDGSEVVSSISKLTETQLNDGNGDQIALLARDADKSASGLSGLTELIEQDVVTASIPLPREKPVSFGDGTAESSQLAKVVEQVVEPQSGGKVLGSAGGRLVLTAKAPVWVRIEDRQGNVVMTQTLNKGDSYRVPEREGLIVIARDGGLISYSIDGVDKGPLGDHGEILVGRSLNLSELAG
jgi:cytoskeleton protein RodZ